MDKDGRFVLVMGELHSVSLTLVNIYCPNFDRLQFFRKVQDLIPDISQTNLIILNTVLYQYLDRSSSQRISSFKFSFWKPTLWTWWTSGELVDANLTPYASDPKYHNIMISDYCPVTFTLRLDLMEKTENHGCITRLGPLLLSDKGFINYLRKKMELFVFV